MNVEMLKFYWSLGADIVRLEKDQPWGSRFMQRVSADLKAWMPEAKCFSVANLSQFEQNFPNVSREKDRVTVQYALESSALPIGVSDYVLERFIPADFKSQMPTIEEVEGELTRRMEIAEVRKSVKCPGQDDVRL